MKNFDTRRDDSIQTQERTSMLTPQSADGAILLVEDDKVLRRYLEVLLRRAGYAVVSVADGVEAIKIAFGSKPVAVITDAIMPRLGGHELCRILRSRAEHARLPIILLSGETRGDSTDAASDHADAHLTKPVRAEELIDCLKRLIARAALV